MSVNGEGCGFRVRLPEGCAKSVIYSASHFSHFLTYLSKRRAMSRMTNVRTTCTKNSDARRSFISEADLRSSGNDAYSGAIGRQQTALVCSSRI